MRKFTAAAVSSTLATAVFALSTLPGLVPARAGESHASGKWPMVVSLQVPGLR